MSVCLICGDESNNKEKSFDPLFLLVQLCICQGQATYEGGWFEESDC